MVRNASRVLLPGHAPTSGAVREHRNYRGDEGAVYFSQTIISDKQHPVLTRKDFMGAHEWCFYWVERGRRARSTARTTSPTCRR